MNGNAARLEFAKLLLRSGQGPAAEAAVRTVLDSTPDAEDALVLLGTLQLERSAADAAAVLTRAIAAGPAAAEAWYIQSIAEWRRGRVEEALRCGRRVWRLGADPVQADLLRQISRGAYNHATERYREGGHAEACGILKLLLDDPDEEVRVRASAYLYGTAAEILKGMPPVNPAAFAPMLADGRVPTSPMRVRVEVSSACNLRCRHCPTGVAYTGTERRLMKPEVFDRVVENLKQLPQFQSCIMYLGGEPLLHPQLPALCRRIRDETGPTRLHFNTNAMLLTEEKCRALAESGLTHIYVSIDGRSPEENDGIRRGASYEKVRENVRMLLRYAEPAGIVVSISNVLVRRPGDPDQPEVPEFLRRDLPGVPVNTTYAMRWPGWDKPKDEASFTITTGSRRRSGFCLMPFSEMAVRANGDVTLCCYDIMGEEVMGRITESSLADIWNGPKYRSIRRAMAEGRIDDVPDVCRRCLIYTGEMLATETADLELASGA